MPADGPDLMKQYERGKSERSLFAVHWERQAHLLAPSRVGIIRQYPQGAIQTSQLFDSTTPMAAELAAHFIAGQVLSPAQQWGRMSMAHPAVVGDDDTQEWLDESRDRQLRLYAESLFYAEATEGLIDWIAFGTGHFIQEEAARSPEQRGGGFRGLACRATRTGRFVIYDGPNGLVDTSFEERKMTASAIQRQWPTGKLPELITRAIAAGKGSEVFTIIHAVAPRPVGSQRTGAGATAMPWLSAWIEERSKQVIYESGYRVFPAAVPRYQRTPGETYGRGRGDLAYPTSWTLNQAVQMSFQDWALKIQPPVLARHNAVFGSLRLVPAGLSTIDTHGGKIEDALRPWQTGSHPEVSQIKEEELRKTINQVFYVQQILDLMQIQKSEMTAFEYGKKLALLFGLIGPVYGRLMREFLTQLWNVTFDLLLHGGVFSPPPPAVYSTDGKIDVIFENPISRSQKAGEAEALGMVLNDLQLLFQDDPTQATAYLKWLDPKEVMPGLLEVRGVPVRWRRSREDVDALEQAEAQAASAQQQLVDAHTLASAAGKAAPMVQALQPAGTA